MRSATATIHALFPGASALPCTPMHRRLFLGAASAIFGGLTGCSMFHSGGDATPPTQPTPAPVASPRKPARIGLALGGGAARGFAHIGVIKALEAQGIR